MSTSEEISALLVTRFGTDPEAIRPEVPLRQLRLDSLALEELRLLIEDRMDIDLEDVVLSSRDTVGHLVAAVRTARPARDGPGTVRTQVRPARASSRSAAAVTGVGLVTAAGVGVDDGLARRLRHGGSPPPCRTCRNSTGCPATSCTPSTRLDTAGRSWASPPSG